MLGTHHIANKLTTHPAAYATSADFCRIFETDMNRLYLLAFLLTTDQALAEKCFVQGLNDSKHGNPVFKEWAQSWARRTVIANAIRLVHPRPGLGATADPAAGRELCGPLSERREDAAPAAEHAFCEEIVAIVALPPFQRFAFVMSVLEGYSNREASLLLDCSVHELVAARTHALEQIAGHPELHRKLVGIDATEASLADAGVAYAREVMAHLAAPA